MKEIISCSRRTDIPAFYYGWLQDKLKEKEVKLINSYNQTEYTVNLNPDNIHSIVLWSKNYNNVIKNPGYLGDYNLYFNFTITGYNKTLEPNVPDHKETFKQVELLATKYSSKQINWRFDPILLSQEGEYNPTEKYGSARLHMFETLCGDISSLGVNRCTISFAELYGKVSERLKKNKFNYLDLSDEFKTKFAERLVEIANKYNIQIYSCSNLLLELVDGIKKAHCIDGELLSELFGKCTQAKDAGQRKACGCVKSKDIGSYNQLCKHNCLYCYANVEI